MPSRSSAARIAFAVATLPGLSPWMHSVPGAQLDDRAVERLDRALHGHPDRACAGHVGVVDDRALGAALGQRAVGRVAAVGEALGDDGLAEPLRRAVQPRAGDRDDRQLRVELAASPATIASACSSLDSATAVLSAPCGLMWCSVRARRA